MHNVSKKDADYARRTKIAKRQKIAGIMNKFYDEGNKTAIMESANIFDFLGLDELLDHAFFSHICWLYEERGNLNASYKKPLELLNPGLAQRIYATKPVYKQPKVGTHKTLSNGYKWHEIAE